MSGEIELNELSRMIRTKRGPLGLRKVAKDAGVSASTLSRVEQGKVPDLDSFIRICNWLEVSTDYFTKNKNKGSEKEATRTIIFAHLRADRTLEPETAEALVKMIQIAYDAVKIGKLEKRPGKNASRIQGVG